MATSMRSAPISDRASTSSDTVSSATKLCNRCQKIPFDDGKYEGFTARSDTGSEYLKLEDGDEMRELDVDFELVDTWPDLDILSTYADTCGFCNLLRLELKISRLHIYLKRGWIRVRLTYHWRDGWRGPPPESNYALFGLEARVFGREDQNEESEFLWTKLRFTIDSVDGPCQRWLRLQAAPPLGHLCEENISKIEALLKESDLTQETIFFPTRVLDLECHSNELEVPSRRIRLVTKEEVLGNIIEFPPYVALSYCWGSAEQASTQSTTTSSNFEKNMMNIDLKTVSIVIQDAVTVCRTFRIRYLWVDAFCIIQDNLQDWERESSIMGDLYRNAYFTIGVASSKSCHDSFLSNSLTSIEFPFSSSLNSGAKGTYRIVARGDTQSPSYAGNEFEDIKGLWMDRGWVLQEMFLSRRLLVFGGNMVHAEFGKTSSIIERMECINLDYDSWRGLMEIYSSTRLTFDKDRLPAISGLARHYAETLGDQYLAGLWRKDMYVALFWSIRSIYNLHVLVESLEAPHPYIAPSWSFARQNEYAEVGFDYFHLTMMGNRQPKCDIIDSRCTVVGLDAFGEISSGFLVLCAKMSALKSDLAVTEGLHHKVWQSHIKGTPVVDLCLDWNLNGEIIREHELLLVLLGSCRDSEAKPCSCGCTFDASEALDKPMLDGDEDETQNELFEETMLSNHEVNLPDQMHSETANDNTSNGGEQEGSDGSSGFDKEDDSISGSNGVQICRSCFEAPSNQSAYGLVLYPAKDAGLFYRVGLFNSQAVRHAPHGGLKLCDTWDTRTITII